MSDTEQTRPHDGDAAFIQALAELLNRNELTELTVKREYGENDKLTVELSKHGKQVIVQAAAEPVAAPFVTVGQQVAEGDTLMIVEAMKTMNHIPAPRAGTVRRIMVEDGTPVEYGTPLMVVE